MNKVGDIYFEVVTIEPSNFLSFCTFCEAYSLRAIASIGDMVTNTFQLCFVPANNLFCYHNYQGDSRAISYNEFLNHFMEGKYEWYSKRSG